MDPSTPTCRSLDQPIAGADLDTFQYYVIDGFITSPDITVNSCKTQSEGFKNTDYNPALISFNKNEYPLKNAVIMIAFLTSLMIQ